MYNSNKLNYIIQSNLMGKLIENWEREKKRQNWIESEITLSGSPNCVTTNDFHQYLIQRIY